MKYHGIIFSSRPNSYERNSGAHRIATFLREHGWDIEVIDFAAYWPLEKLQELVRMRTTKNTIFFGFSTFLNHWNPTMDNLTKFIKEKFPHVSTILGATNAYYTNADPKNIDYWIDSYGELAMLELVKGLVGNTRTGIKFEMSTFGSKKLIKSITSYPAYDLKSYKNLLEKRDFVKDFEWLAIEFARGCKFNCSYCNFPVLGVKHDNSRTKEDFEWEMKHNYDMFGVTNYTVADETFNDRKEKIMKFADVAETLKFRPFFSGYIRADLATSNKDTWEHLARLNFAGHFYGIESFNRKSAKAMGKGMEPEKLKQGLLDLRSYMQQNGDFYRSTISFIIGLPYDTEESWLQTENWLMDNWTDQSMIAFPLHLINPAKTDEIHKTVTNISDLSKNPGKYNITEMDPSEVPLVESGGHIATRKKWYPEDTYFWKHDTSDMFKAEKLADDITKRTNGKFAINNFSLPAIEFAQHKKAKNLNDIAAYKWSTKDFFREINPNYSLNVFLDEYIENKINWVG
jgi:hypothetical protein